MRGRKLFIVINEKNRRKKDAKNINLVETLLSSLDFMFNMNRANLSTTLLRYLFGEVQDPSQLCNQ